MPPFGRLDVFFPDGKFQTFPLSEPTTSVGRSTGNTIPLDTNNISRYHISIGYEDEQVSITDLDSANGTYVDGMKLESSQPQYLYGGEEILIGDLRLIFVTFDDSPTRPTIVPEETTQRIELEAPAFRIDVKGPNQPVSPGAHIAAELSITNTGFEPERFVTSVTGLPRDWVRVDRQIVEVAPGKTEQVVLSFKPLRRPDSTPGEYPVLVSVHPNRESVTLLNADLVLTVLPYSGFGMALERREVDEREQFRLHLHNQGSAPLPLRVSIEDAGNLLNASLSASQVTLQPGQRTIVQGSIHPRKRALFGASQRLPFDIRAQSQDAAGFVAAQRAYVTTKPPMPAWAPLALLGVVGLLAVLLIGAIMLLSNQPTTPPVIERFTVSQAQLTQGEPLVVSWAASNVSDLTLTVNGTPMFSQEGGVTATNYTLNTSELAGNVQIGVIASNGQDTVTAGEQVFVVSPMRVDLFTVDPPRLVRNVVQPISVAWDVPGATTTRLIGLEGFTTAGIEPSYGAEAELTNIVGIPETPLTLTLNAQDAEGNALEQSIVVDVIDPLCSAVGDAATLYAEPRADAQVVGTVPEDSSVVVDAQDESRQWLRVALTGGVAGWGARTAFECAETFDAANLRQVLVIPTVMPTIPDAGTPTATSGPLVTATPRPSVTPTRQPTATRAATLSATATAATE